MKGEIYEFDPVIYPTRLWVSLCPSLDTFLKKFQCLSDDGEMVSDEESEKTFKKHCTSVCTTFAVVDRESRWMGCLVVVWNRSEYTVGRNTHETFHVVDWIDDEIGLEGHSFMDGEPRAYLGEWVSNCIDNVIKGKV